LHTGIRIEGLALFYPQLREHAEHGAEFGWGRLCLDHGVQLSEVLNIGLPGQDRQGHGLGAYINVTKGDRLPGLGQRVDFDVIGRRERLVDVATDGK